MGPLPVDGRARALLGKHGGGNNIEPGTSSVSWKCRARLFDDGRAGAARSEVG